MTTLLILGLITLCLLSGSVGWRLKAVRSQVLEDQLRQESQELKRNADALLARHEAIVRDVAASALRAFREGGRS